MVIFSYDALTGIPIRWLLAASDEMKGTVDTEWEMNIHDCDEEWAGTTLYLIQQ